MAVTLHVYVMSFFEEIKLDQIEFLTFSSMCVLVVTYIKDNYCQQYLIQTAIKVCIYRTIWSNLFHHIIKKIFENIVVLAFQMSVPTQYTVTYMKNKWSFLLPYQMTCQLMRLYRTACKVALQIANTPSCIASLELPVVQGLVLNTLSMRNNSIGTECHI